MPFGPRWAHADLEAADHHALAPDAVPVGRTGRRRAGTGTGASSASDRRSSLDQVGSRPGQVRCVVARRPSDDPGARRPPTAAQVGRRASGGRTRRGRSGWVRRAPRRPGRARPWGTTAAARCPRRTRAAARRGAARRSAPWRPGRPDRRRPPRCRCRSAPRARPAAGPRGRGRARGPLLPWMRSAMARASVAARGSPAAASSSAPSANSDRVVDGSAPASARPARGSTLLGRGQADHGRDQVDRRFGERPVG